jgi:hypothetical protein
VPTTISAIRVKFCAVTSMRRRKPCAAIARSSNPIRRGLGAECREAIAMFGEEVIPVLRRA